MGVGLPPRPPSRLRPLSLAEAGAASPVSYTQLHSPETKLLAALAVAALA